MTTPLLTVNRFSQVNWARHNELLGDSKNWDQEALALAANGPTGYIGHLFTQIKRGSDIAPGEIFDEIADAVIYLDLLTTTMGGCLDQVLARKFNVNSDESGAGQTLPVPTR